VLLFIYQVKTKKVWQESVLVFKRSKAVKKEKMREFAFITTFRRTYADMNLFIKY
jgi:hypothetical protein